ncbi:hypothetical protein J4Q44_G00054760 [Coregonus suidteri]|uniref:Uncharacterized protein n=1 Tax=Coregonus suidteri TaxID=861788 RepID=A0AAN8RDB4_9TELE
MIIATPRERISLKMLYSRCMIAVLGLYLMLGDLSAFLLPDRLRQKRDVNWLDQEFFPHLSELSDLANLSPPGDAGETTQDWEERRFQSATFLSPLERISTPMERISTAVERISTPMERISTAVERISTPMERTSTAVERISVHHHNDHRRKPKDKRRKATVPLDSIGSGLMYNQRSRKDEPEG